MLSRLQMSAAVPFSNDSPVPSRSRWSTVLYSWTVLAAVYLCMPSRAAAQWFDIYIYPYDRVYTVGASVPVTIDLCVFEGSLAWGSIDVSHNGVYITSEFEYQGWPSVDCQILGGTDGFTLTGGFTAINGNNGLLVEYSTSLGSGNFTEPFYATYAATVTPKAGSGGTQTAYTSGLTKTFTVTNYGWNSNTYTLHCIGSDSVVCRSASSTSVNLASGASANITANYSVNGTGSGTLGLIAIASSGGVADSGSYNITVGSQTSGAPRVIAPVLRPGTGCASCFGAAYSQGTVPYFSLSTPRSVTFVYNGDRLNPKQFVHVDVKRDAAYGTDPAEWRLQAKVNGSLVTFTNGEQTLKFSYGGYADSLYQRIGGLFDASGYATGSYPLEVLVSAYYSGGGGTLITTAVTAKLVVVNGGGLGNGWGLGGIERLFLQTDGSAVVTMGDGSAVYFQRATVGGPFKAPLGEFSKLVHGTPTGGTGWTRLFADSTKIVYNSSGLMTEVRDRWNNKTTIVYSGTAVSQIKDPLDSALVLDYNQNGGVTVTDFRNRTTTATGAGWPSYALTAIQDPDGVSTSFGYDGSSRLSGITDRRGYTTNMTYDAWGRVDSVKSPSAVVIEPNGDTTTTRPTIVQTSWQRYGVPTSGTSGTPAAAVRSDTVRATLKEAGGALARFTVNRWGAPTQITAPLGHVTTILYDNNGLPIRTTAPTGAFDSVAYNSNGLPVYARSAPDSGVYYRYGAWAEADSIWGYQRPIVRNVIGANGRISSSTVGGATTNYWYDSRGRVDSITDPMGHLTRRRWYSTTNGNATKDSVPGGRVTELLYDAYGRDSATKAPGLATQRTIYDVLNRVIAYYDGVYATPDTVFYNPLFPDSVKLKKAQKYGASYNALGLVVRRIDPTGRSDTLAYSRDGELRRWVNRRGEATMFTYDSLHRPLKTWGANTPVDSIVYSDYGRTVAASDSVSVETTFFGLHGRPDSILTQIAGETYRRRYKYNANGYHDSTVISGPVSFLARRYTYDATKYALTGINLASSSTEFTLNSDYLTTGVNLPGTASIARYYSTTHSHAVEVVDASYADSVNRFAGYDKAERLRRMVRATSNQHGSGFGYDSLGRLIADTNVYHSPSGSCGVGVDANGATCTTTTEGWTNEGFTLYSYDSLGNRSDLGATYGAANRISQFDSCSYVTDTLDGNVHRRGCGNDTVRFHWSAQSRLRALKIVGGDSLEFAYDGAGRLVRRKVNGTPRYLLWDGPNVLAEIHSDGSKVAEYSYYPGTDNLHALIIGATPYFAHSDMADNVLALADSNQNLARTYRYTRWGAANGGVDYVGFSGIDRARFKGAIWMGTQVDIYYMRHRWYEPRSGRFLSEDPLGLGDDANLYAFADNDPANLRDPFGLNPPQPCGGDPPPTGGPGGDEGFQTPRKPDPKDKETPTCDGINCITEEIMANCEFPPLPPCLGGSCHGSPLPHIPGPETGEGGGGPAADPPPQALPPPPPFDVGRYAARQCGYASFGFATTGILDAGVLWGAYKAVKMGIRGATSKALGLRRARAGRWAAGRNNYRIGVNTLDDARRAGVAIGADHAKTSWLTVYNGAINSSLSWKDFIPLVASKRAYDTMRAACLMGAS